MKYELGDWNALIEYVKMFPGCTAKDAALFFSVDIQDVELRLMTLGLRGVLAWSPADTYCFAVDGEKRVRK